MFAPIPLEQTDRAQTYRSAPVYADVRRKAAWQSLVFDIVLTTAGTLASFKDIILYDKFGVNLNFTAIALGAALPVLVSGLAGIVADTLELNGKIEHDTAYQIKQIVTLTAFLTAAIAMPILFGPVGYLSTASNLVQALMILGYRGYQDNNSSTAYTRSLSSYTPISTT